MKHESLPIETMMKPDVSYRLLTLLKRTGQQIAIHVKKLDSFLYNEFIFSSRYKVLRHVSYWTVHVSIWAVFWIVVGNAPVSFGRQVFSMILWVPVFILFGYPMTYWAVPKLLFQGKVIQFLMVILAWALVGLYINYGFRTFLYVPIQEAMGFDYIPPKGQQPHSYLCMTTSAASPMMIKFFKLWTLRQREWLKNQQEKISAELQLLKAQVHPEFLFNTLSSIHSFSVERPEKTPGLILKVSSLLSYMLYDCHAEEARLEKEVEVMKNYSDLESERCGGRIEVSWSEDGITCDRFILPLLMLPFLENAFKHAVAADVERPWISIDLSLRGDVLRCKIANSKSELVRITEAHRGKDIANVTRRLTLMYPDAHELKTHDEGTFYVVSLMVRLSGFRQVSALAPLPHVTHQILAV